VPSIYAGGIATSPPAFLAFNQVAAGSNPARPTINQAVRGV